MGIPDTDLPDTRCPVFRLKQKIPDDWLFFTYANDFEKIFIFHSSSKHLFSLWEQNKTGQYLSSLLLHIRSFLNPVSVRISVRVISAWIPGAFIRCTQQICQNKKFNKITFLRFKKNSVLRSRSRSQNYLRPGAGAEIIFLINISYSQFGGC